MPEQDSTTELAVTAVADPPVPAPPGPAATPSWWSTGWTGQRPTIGTIPALRRHRSFTRSRLLPALMVLCGATALAASTMPWLTADLGVTTTRVFGTDHAVSTAFGIDGWASFAAGGALVVLSALMMVSDDRALRALAALVAAGLAAIGGYELIRVLQQIHYARQAAARLYPSLAAHLAGRAHVGYGLVMVGAAAGVALVAGMIEAAAR